MKQFAIKTKNNKSNKNTKGKSNSKSVVKVTPKKKPVIMHLFYMTENAIDCVQLVTGIAEEDGMTVDVWEDMSIATIEYSANEGIDFEECDVDSFDSESDIEFVQSHNIKTIYQVTLVDSLKEKAGRFFQTIIDTNGGFFCSDTDDFEPVFDKEELKQWI